MREYVGKTGGRFLYVDDIESLQELAKSATAIFHDFGNMVISGCIPTEGKLTEGFVFLNGRIRKLGNTSVEKYPLYICEKQIEETLPYKDEQVKLGAINYTCEIKYSKPEDGVEFIEVNKDNSKNKTLKNVFFGKHSVSNSPASGKQSVKGNITFDGEVNVNKSATISDGLTVGDSTHIESVDGGVNISTIKGGVRNVRVFVGEDEVVFFGDDKNLVIKNGSIELQEVKTSIIKASSISSVTGILKVNDMSGKLASFEVYDGVDTKPYIKSSAGSKDLFVTKRLVGSDVVAKDYVNNRKSVNYLSRFLLTDSESIITGFLETNNKRLILEAVDRNITIKPKKDGVVDIDGDVAVKGLEVDGVNISDMFASKEDFDTLSKEAVRSKEGKTLTTNDFTNEHKNKLDGIKTSTIESGGDGYVVASDVSDALNDYIRKEHFVRDLYIDGEDDEKLICNHIGALHKTNAQQKLKQTEWMNMNHYSGGKIYTLWVKQFGSVVHITGTLNTSEHSAGEVFARLPNEISSPSHPVVYAVNDISSKQGNRGVEFQIKANGRELKQARRNGYGNTVITINLTYII